MGKVLKSDVGAPGFEADAYAAIDLGAAVPELWVTAEIYFDPTSLADGHITAWMYALFPVAGLDPPTLSTMADGVSGTGGSADPWTTFYSSGGALGPGGAWIECEFHHVNGGASNVYIDGLLTVSGTDTSAVDIEWVGIGQLEAGSETSPSIVYIRNVQIGTTRGASDLFADDFSSGDFSAWTTTSGDATIVDDPLGPATFSGQRVGVAWDDGPLEPNPTWTWLDDGVTFPPNFVAGYDTQNGRQTLISQTETGTATVYINDRIGLFDDRNDDSPYQGKLSGRQIILQLYNPVTEMWEPQFRGLLDNYSYDINNVLGADGKPIVATIQLECVDVFDYLNGYLLTPGLDGVTPPVGGEDGVWYDETTGGVIDRFLAILGNAGIDSTMYIVASGNTNVLRQKYDVGESALGACRDAADGELPFIANIYVNRYGQFVFRGRYSRFNPDEVAAEPGSEWDFQRWPIGDETAILVDPTRGQIREFSYKRDMTDLINSAIAYPKGTKPADIPGQVYANVPSMDAYGQHQAQPMSNLLTADYTGPGTITPPTGLKQCAMFSELLVKNKKDPRIIPTKLQLKSMRPEDPRAEATWGAICGADISHIVNIAVGYAGGTGLVGDSPQDDFYIEGRALTVRPLNSQFDYVECDLEVSPAIWSMDTEGVFPAFDS